MQVDISGVRSLTRQVGFSAELAAGQAPYRPHTGHIQATTCCYSCSHTLGWTGRRCPHSPLSTIHYPLSTMHHAAAWYGSCQLVVRRERSHLSPLSDFSLPVSFFLSFFFLLLLLPLLSVCGYSPTNCANWRKMTLM
jgi:hypothetical protein